MRGFIFPPIGKLFPTFCTPNIGKKISFLQGLNSSNMFLPETQKIKKKNSQPENINFDFYSRLHALVISFHAPIQI